MKTIQAIKCLSIRAYLAGRGLRPTKDNPRYGLYLSPLRKEHTPEWLAGRMYRVRIFEWRKKLFGGRGAQSIGKIKIKHGKQVCFGGRL